MKYEKITASEFARLAKIHRLRGATLEAARLVLVDGLTCYAAAKRAALYKSTVSRAVARLQRPLCPACGRPKK